MSAPKITIVTPSFNQGSFISQTLKSVRSQKFQEIEHLIYDPGSTDGSIKKIENHCKNYDNATLILGKDKSQTNAINLGFSHAQGDILCWLNSDDTFFDSEVLTTVKNEFDKDPKIDIIYGRGQFISSEGDFLREAYINRDHSKIRALMANSIGILQPSLFMRRHVFEEVGALDERMDFSFDYEYWARCAQRGKVFQFIDQLMSRAVIHDAAKTMRMRDVSLVEAMTVARRYYGFVSNDWIRRKADHELNESDGIINVQVDAEEIADLSTSIFAEQNSSNTALSAYFNKDPMMNTSTREAFEALAGQLFDRAYLSGWDAKYFDMGVTFLASVHRNDPETWVFVYDLGMTDAQVAFLRLLDRVIILDRDFVPFQHEWQKSPKNYVFKIALFHHLLSYLAPGSRLLWVDAGVMLLQKTTEIFEQISTDEVFFVDHSDSRHWPLFNASFTSDAAILAGQFTPAELSGPHVCSCLFGCLAGSKAQEMFAEAARIAEIEKIAVGDKHPPEADRCDALSKENQVLEAKRLAQGHDPVKNTAEVRRIFGYYGHRQDQSIISLLVARYEFPISSAAKYCPANDASSQVSKENWFDGLSNRLGDFAPVPENQVGITFHHRGLVKDFRGLLFSFNREPVAGILGNGPSLANVDLPALKNTDSFGMNAAYRFWGEIDWYPQYYSCLDAVVGMSHKQAIRDLIRNRHVYGIKAFLLRNNLVKWLAETGDLDGVIDFDLIRFGVEEFLPEPVTTGSHTLGWASLLGYSQIFIAGVDCSYTENNDNIIKKTDGTLEVSKGGESPNYFFADYQKAGDQFNVPNPSKDLHVRSWRNISTVLPPGMMVRNVSLDSRMDAFQKNTLETTLEGFKQLRAFGNPIRADGETALFELIDAQAQLSTRDGQVLLAFEDPVLIVAQALENKNFSNATLGNWLEHSVELLSVLCKNPDQLVLLERFTLLRYPDAYRALLSNEALNLPAILPSAVAVPKPLYMAIAHMLVDERSEVRNTRDELYTRATWPSTIQLDQRENISDLVEHLDEMQLAINEGTALRAVLHRQSEQIIRLRKAVGQNKREIEENKRELNSVYQSKSWKITGPMRSLRRFISGFRRNGLRINEQDCRD